MRWAPVEMESDAYLTNTLMCNQAEGDPLWATVRLIFFHRYAPRECRGYPLQPATAGLWRSGARPFRRGFNRPRTFYT